MRHPKRVGAIVLLLAALVSITRGFTLGMEVVDWDESTFILMAQDVLRGHLPYVALFDNKPPGIFFALAGAMAVLGQSVTAVRIFGGLLLLATAVQCFGIGRRYVGDWLAGLIAGALVAATLSSFGIHTSTELLANVFVTGALWLILARGERLWTAAGVGLLLSLATLTRTNLAFAVLAVGGLYLVAPFVRGLRLHPAGIIGYGLGGLVPVAALVGIYAAQGEFAILYNATVTVPFSYVTNQDGPMELAAHLGSSLAGLIDEITPATGLLFVLAAIGLFGLLVRSFRSAALPLRDLAIVFVMFLGVLVSLFLGGVFYSHYLLQLFPFLAVLAALGGPTGKRQLLSFTALAATAAVAVCLAFTAPATAVLLTGAQPIDGAYSLEQAATAIRADRRPGDEVFALEGTQLALFYLDQPPLSLLAASPENLLRPEIARPLHDAGRVTENEFARILGERPRYLIRREGPSTYLTGQPRDDLETLLTTRYEPWLRIKKIVVFRRLD